MLVGWWDRGVQDTVIVGWWVGRLAGHQQSRSPVGTVAFDQWNDPSLRSRPCAPVRPHHLAIRPFPLSRYPAIPPFRYPVLFPAHGEPAHFDAVPLHDLFRFYLESVSLEDGTGDEAGLGEVLVYVLRLHLLGSARQKR